MSSLEAFANVLRIVGLILVIPGLWWLAGGMRVVVSGRIDERRRSASALKLGLPLLIVSLLLIFGGTWLVNWARMS